MKKLPFILSVFLFLSASAQVEKGRFLIGGSADISGVMQGKNSGFNLSVVPTFGTFVVKGFAIGARYSFTINNTRIFDNDEQKHRAVTSFVSGIGPQLKYYFGKKQLKGLLSANVNYLTSTTLREKRVIGSNGFSAIGLLGMAYFLNEHIALESGLYLSATSMTKQLPVTRIGFSVGFFTFLNKKKQE